MLMFFLPLIFFEAILLNPERESAGRENEERLAGEAVES
jgi:hypothetical protein